MGLTSWPGLAGDRRSATVEALVAICAPCPSMLRSALGRASLPRWRRALSSLPESPLEKFVQGDGFISAGFGPDFKPRAGADRSAARKFRADVRDGRHAGQTSGYAPGFVQANFVALPRSNALDFLTFCLRNPRPCPLLAVTEPGSRDPGGVAPGADLATDIPRYRVFRHGVCDDIEPADVRALWTEDMVGFLLGCSFSWEALLAEKGFPPRHFERGCNVSMYRTSVPNRGCGPFRGRLVVSMRPYTPDDVPAVASITEAFPGAHGSPIHWGSPNEIGIDDLSSPDYGDAVDIGPGEVPVFWACGVTPQTAIEEAAAELPLAITHSPGHMFVTDLLNEEIGVQTSST